jgi:hypothetical protein
VSVRDGQTLASDGPFAEAKELLAGFFLLECESIDRAVEVAALAPPQPEPVPAVDDTLTLLCCLRRSPSHRRWP